MRLFDRRVEREKKVEEQLAAREQSLAELRAIRAVQREDDRSPDFGYEGD